MNLRSSIAVTLFGSVIATVRVRPSRFRGRTACLIATSGGISLMIFGSTSKRDRSTAGIRYCRASILEISVSSTKPSFTRVYPRRIPVFFCSRSAFLSWSWVISPSRRRISPSLSEVAAAVAVRNSLKLNGITYVAAKGSQPRKAGCGGLVERGGGGWRWCKSRYDPRKHHVSSDCLEEFRTDTRDAVEARKPAERAVLLAPRDDALRERRADPRQPRDLRHVGAVEVDAPARE